MYFSILLHVHRSCLFPEGVMSPEEDLTHCHEKVVAQVELASSACPFLKSRFQTIFESILEVFLGKQPKYFVISGIYAGYIKSRSDFSCFKNWR